MGFKLAYIAVLGQSEEDILKKFALAVVPNTSPSIDQNDNFVGTQLTTGWYLILDATFALPERLDTLALLSQKARVLTCGIIETTNYSFASEWQQGTCLWNIENNCDNYPDTSLSVSGETPPRFKQLRDDADAEGEFFDADEGWEPNYADIPGQLVADQCGYSCGYNHLFSPGTTKVLTTV